jgi:hypothetical protein
MEDWMLVERDMLPIRHMAVFCSVLLSERSSGLTVGMAPSFWTRTWLIALEA